jgi:hypothetical protein
MTTPAAVPGPYRPRFAGNGPAAMDPVDQPEWHAYEDAADEEYYANAIHKAPGNGWSA